MKEHVVFNFSKEWSVEYKISEKSGNAYLAFCHNGEMISMLTSADRTSAKLALQAYKEEHKEEK